MSYFWKPCRRSTARELWARCDICLWSGPSTSFFEAWHEREKIRITVCEGCGGDEHMMAHMLERGWECK